MFNMNRFLMKTIKGMIGAYPDFQAREYALNWYAKGKLTEEDLFTVDTLIEAQYIVHEVVDDVEEVESEPLAEEIE